MRTGLVIAARELGTGTSAAVRVSSKAIVIVRILEFWYRRLMGQGLTHSTSTLHILHPTTLEPLRKPINNVSTDAHSGLPAFDLSSRLLAYATSDPPQHPGPDSLGSIITAKSTPRPLSRPAVSPGLSISQNDMITSAIDVGGGVARGVWAGLKMSARAANSARLGRLARSAPAEATLGLNPEDDMDSTGSVMLNDGSGQEGMGSASGGRGIWIKIIDLCPRTPSRSSQGMNSSNRDNTTNPDVIAHFRLPTTRTHHAGEKSRSRDHTSPVSHLCFSPSGTKLFAADDEGRSFRILEVRPAGARRGEMRGEVKGEVWDLYELRRGNSLAQVDNVKWAEDERWVGVGTGKGTIRKSP
jgi:hypothetical protein